MILPFALLLLLSLPQTPDVTQPPASAHIRLTAVGLGVQIYRCKASSATDATLQWVLEGPEATLFDPTTKQEVGTHSTGPTWTWKDGSAIIGKVLQKQPSPDAASIPWLLLETEASGTITGTLTGITFVRRSDTQAGAAPSKGCDAVHQDNLVRVPYQATYTFYTPN